MMHSLGKEDNSLRNIKLKSMRESRMNVLGKEGNSLRI
jgi:hypothetical protein